MTAGALTQNSVSSTSANLTSAVATAGTAPYTYQWYRSTATGFTPGGGNLISGATALNLIDTGLTPGTNYFYKVVATDSAGTPVTATSSQLAVSTLAASLSQNQFSQAPFLGQVDQAFNYNTQAVQFDAAQTGTVVAGAALKWATTAGGLPKVVAATAASDVVAGFLNFNMKDRSYSAKDVASMSSAGNVIYLYAALAINRGQFVTSLPAAAAGGCNGGVVPTAGGSLPIVGYALDTVAIGQLVRIQLMTPTPAYQIG